jgi:hypothetical protein
MAAESVTAEKIKAGSVSADRLDILAKNLTNPLLDPAAGKRGWSGAFDLADGDGLAAGCQVAKITGAMDSPRVWHSFPISPDDILELTFSWRTDAAHDARFVVNRIGAPEYDGVKISAWSDSARAWGAFSDVEFYVYQAPVPTRWTGASFYIVGSNVAPDLVPAPTEEEKAAGIARINDGAAAAEEAFQRYRVELEERANAEILAAREEASQRIEGLEREKYERMAGRVGQYAGYVRDAASSIYEIWSNTIQAELDERLDALDKENLSAEERAEAEKKLRRAAADEQHKAAVFQWTLSVAMAAVNAAQAVLAALANPGGPAGIALAAVAGALGALQVAAIASAKPKKPSFHSGGVVQGRGEVDATLLGGEVVQTPAQFKTVMDAMANLAAMDAAKAPAVDVVVNNNAAASARVQQPRVDGDKIIFTIEQIMGDAIAGGKADGAFERRDARARGQSLMTY